MSHVSVSSWVSPDLVVFDYSQVCSTSVSFLRYPSVYFSPVFLSVSVVSSPYAVCVSSPVLPELSVPSFHVSQCFLVLVPDSSFGVDFSSFCFVKYAAAIKPPL